MPRPRILVVDDEDDLRTLMRMSLTRLGADVSLAANLAQARSALQQQRFEVCLTDMTLPDGTGLELVDYIAREHAQLPVAVITAYGSMDTAVDALKAGAFDFVSKPVDMTRLRELIGHALRLKKTTLKAKPPLEQTNLIGDSPVIHHLRQTIHKIARSQAPVFIQGESGTGKEVVARLIHQLGPRAQAPFVAINCGAIPSELMESEFFGHTKGSFTGATDDKLGLFRAAQGGTLFLDEVADLPLSMQVKLLRAVQEKKVRPIGATQEISVDVRLLSATHNDLAARVQDGRFRQDLFYRINVIELAVPPLRERGGDIGLLADSFLRQYAQSWGYETVQLTPQARHALLTHRFPGNVRELQNILERALTLSEGMPIEEAHLMLEGDNKSALRPLGSELEQPALSLARASTAHSQPAQSRALAVQDLAMQGLEGYLQEIEKDILVQTLESTQWNRTAAARKLGLTFRSLRYRLKKLGLDAADDTEGTS